MRIVLPGCQVSVFGLMLGLVLGCAPAASGPTAGSVAPTAGPKVLVWATQLEPDNLGPLIGFAGATRPITEFRHVVHNQLLVQDNVGAYHPQLALELPSLEKQTWRVNPDGTMDTTWRIQENVTWHDGTRFTSADLLFTFNLLKDPSAPLGGIIGLRQMASASAPDPWTFSIHWSETFFAADRSPDTGPAPRHLLEELYHSSGAVALPNATYFTTGFVGLGPYRLSKWEPGSSAEFERFDGYYHGRPALDRLAFQFVTDPNALVSYALSGSADVATASTVEIGSILEVQRQWMGTGNVVAIDTIGSMWYLGVQWRPEYARPARGWADPRVRHALYHAIDRAALAEAQAHGLAPVADSWFSPSDPLRGQVESAIPQYPYDRRRAQELLTEAGWVRGPDGTLVHQASGERFETEVWSRPGHEDTAQIIGNDWKAVGVQAGSHGLSLAQLRDRELSSSFPGVLTLGPPAQGLWDGQRLHSRSVSGPANRWAGTNQTGYRNPTADELQDRLSITIEPAQRVAVFRQLLQVVMGDLAVMPLRWNIKAAFALHGVKGPITGQATGWNVHIWDKG